MGMFDAIFGGGAGSKAGHGAMRNSMFNPFTFSGAWGGMGYTPGYTPTKKEWRQGMRPTPGNFSGEMSPEMAALRGGFLGNAMGELEGMGQSAGGFLGITPEMFQEFLASNNDMGQQFMDASKGYLEEEQNMAPFDFDATYSDRLANMRALDAPLEERGRLGNIESQYGKGILASTAGKYQTEGLERGLAAKDIMRHDSAFGQAMGREQQNMAMRQMLQAAGMGFGQAGTGMANERFARAMNLFGAGQHAEQGRSSRALGALGGIGSMDQFMANLFQMSGNMGAQQSGANAQAWQPYVQSKMMGDQFGMDFLGQLMGGMTIPVGGGGFGLPGRAFGGPVMPGQPYMVGEHGPEIVMPSQPGTVMPNPATTAAYGGMKQGMAAMGNYKTMMGGMQPLRGGMGGMIASHRPAPGGMGMPGQMPKGGYFAGINPQAMMGSFMRRSKLQDIFSQQNRFL